MNYKASLLLCSMFTITLLQAGEFPLPKDFVESEMKGRNQMSYDQVLLRNFSNVLDMANDDTKNNIPKCNRFGILSSRMNQAYELIAKNKLKIPEHAELVSKIAKADAQWILENATHADYIVGSTEISQAYKEKASTVLKALSAD